VKIALPSASLYPSLSQYFKHDALISSLSIFVLLATPQLNVPPIARYILGFSLQKIYLGALTKN
jgi:hypothetical protein